MLFGNGSIGFLETHYQPGAMHTSIRRLLRLTVESWEEGGAAYNKTRLAYM